MKYPPIALFIAASTAFASQAATPAPMPVTAVQVASHQTQTAHYYRMSLGDWQLTALSDGTVTIPLDKLLTNITPPQLHQQLAAAGMTAQAKTSINAFVINTGRQLILVDSGAGELMGNNGGRLPENMRAAGIDPAAISMVLLTHIHGDHSGGLQRNGKPVFPNAVVRVEQQDVDFWLNTAHRDKVEESQRHTFAESEQSLRPIIQAGKLQPFSAPLQILPGIDAIPAAGHTPGSVLYRIRHDGKTLIMVGDLIHAQRIQLPDPAVAIHFDVNQRQAISTRQKVLYKLAESGDWVAAAHISFPGIGNIARQDGGYRWVPVSDSIKQ